MAAEKTPAGAMSDAVARMQGGRVSIGGMADQIGDRAFGFLLLAFTLPNFGLIPSVPLLPLVCGVPAMILAAQMVAGRQSPWLPDWASRLSVGNGAGVRLAALGDRVARLGKPRLGWIMRGVSNRVLGAAAFILSAAVCAPLPGLNIIPGAGLLLLCAGIFCGDGALAVGGIAVGALGCIIAVAALRTFGLA